MTNSKYSKVYDVNEQVELILELVDELDVESIPHLSINFFEITMNDLKHTYTKMDRDLIVDYLLAKKASRSGKAKQSNRDPVMEEIKRQAEMTELTNKIMDLVEENNLTRIEGVSLDLGTLTHNRLGKHSKEELTLLHTTIQNHLDQQLQTFQQSESKPNNEKADKIKYEILMLAEDLEIDRIREFSELDFAKLTVDDLAHYELDELESMLDVLEGQEIVSAEIKMINHLVRMMNITKLPSLDIHFTEMTDYDFRYTISKKDRQLLLKTLEELYESGYEEDPLDALAAFVSTSTKDKEEQTERMVEDQQQQTKNLELIRKIMNLVEENNLTSIAGNIQLTNLNEFQLEQQSKTELILLLDAIETHIAMNEKYGNASQIEEEDDLLEDEEEEEARGIKQDILMIVEESRINHIPEFRELDFATVTIDDLNNYDIEDLKSMLSFLETQEITTNEIKRIFELANILNMRELPDLGIDFTEITDEELRYSNSKEDRQFIIQTLEDLYEKGYDQTTNDFINPLEVIEKYKYGALKDTDEWEDEKKEDTSWRKHIPPSVKTQLPSWRNDSVHEFYEKVKVLMQKSRGRDLAILREYVCDLSEIVFDQPEEKDEEEQLMENADEDEIASAILTIVEMIILPHQEVLERIEQKGGQILFSNVWSQPFTETLKKEVKDRDGWACVVCDSDKGLHVHHKIPRKYGGVNHKHNLVTLCSSCHPAIETADIRHAFTKCLANYRMNQNKKIRKPVSTDKTILKREVEQSLDHLFLALSNRNENELIEEVLGIMKRLEVIFYD
ncbi:HNH endonuclease [Alkalihalobacterium sp. APHAB7]|uniref:HNH endonuclease n=1 Tax=Alkalihalobacterium sp. APHAB7 TaxID=3402081 RepID=UPI003AB0711F